MFQFPLFDPIDPEFRPIIDNVTLPASPRDLLMNRQFTKVPVILGTVRNEFGKCTCRKFTLTVVRDSDRIRQLIIVSGV